MEVGTSLTSHSPNKPGPGIDNIETDITNTKPTNQPFIFLKKNILVDKIFVKLEQLKTLICHFRISILNYLSFILFPFVTAVAGSAYLT